MLLNYTILTHLLNFSLQFFCQVASFPTAWEDECLHVQSTLEETGLPCRMNNGDQIVHANGLVMRTVSHATSSEVYTHSLGPFQSSSFSSSPFEHTAVVSPNVKSIPLAGTRDTQYFLQGSRTERSFSGKSKIGVFISMSRRTSTSIHPR